MPGNVLAWQYSERTRLCRQGGDTSNFLDFSVLHRLMDLDGVPAGMQGEIHDKVALIEAELQIARDNEFKRQKAARDAQSNPQHRRPG